MVLFSRNPVGCTHLAYMYNVVKILFGMVCFLAYIWKELEADWDWLTWGNMLKKSQKWSHSFKDGWHITCAGEKCSWEQGRACLLGNCENTALLWGRGGGDGLGYRRRAAELGAAALKQNFILRASLQLLKKHILVMKLVLRNGFYMYSMWSYSSSFLMWLNMIIKQFLVLWTNNACPLIRNSTW